MSPFILFNMNSVVPLYPGDACSTPIKSRFVVLLELFVYEAKVFFSFFFFTLFEFVTLKPSHIKSGV